MGFFRDLLAGAPDPGASDEGSEPRSGTDLGDGYFAELTERRLRKGDDKLRVGLEMLHAGIEPDREHEIRLARTRWLEANRAIGSFGCGVALPAEGATPVDDPWDERRALAEPVTVAVLQDAFVFLREGSIEPGQERVLEVGRFPRAALDSIHLEDARGNRVIGPAGDVFEPAAPCRLVVTWRRDDGTEDHDAFEFMSLSVAEETAARFRRFASPA